MPFASNLIQVAPVEVTPVQCDPQFGIIVGAFRDNLKLARQPSSGKSPDAFLSQYSSATGRCLVFFLESRCRLHPGFANRLKRHPDAIVLNENLREVWIIDLQESAGRPWHQHRRSSSPIR